MEAEIGSPNGTGSETNSYPSAAGWNKTGVSFVKFRGISIGQKQAKTQGILLSLHSQTPTLGWQPIVHVSPAYSPKQLKDTKKIKFFHKVVYLRVNKPLAATTIKFYLWVLCLGAPPPRHFSITWVLDAEHLALLRRDLDLALQEDGAQEKCEVVQEVQQQNHHNYNF